MIILEQPINKSVLWNIIERVHLGAKLVRDTDATKKLRAALLKALVENNWCQKKFKLKYYLKRAQKIRF